MAEHSSTASIDVRGKKITTFILYSAAGKLSELGEGEVLEIVAEDFEPIEGDIAAWCRMTGHKLVGVERNADGHRYYIEKAAPNQERKALAFVISDPGLGELISPLGFALAAALSETDVYLYFQGPGVKVLKTGFQEKLHGFSRLFSGLARKQLDAIGHVPPQEKLKQLREVGAHLYACGPSMEQFGVKKEQLLFDDIIVSEYVAFMEIMKKADVQFFLQ